MLGVGGVFAGWQELSVLLAAAGVFVVAQAADVDRDLDWLYYMVSWVVPVGGALTFFAIAGMVLQSDASQTMQVLGVGTSANLHHLAARRSDLERPVACSSDAPPNHRCALGS